MSEVIEKPLQKTMENTIESLEKKQEISMKEFIDAADKVKKEVFGTYLEDKEPMPSDFKQLHETNPIIEVPQPLIVSQEKLVDQYKENKLNISNEYTNDSSSKDPLPNVTGIMDDKVNSYSELKSCEPTVFNEFVSKIEQINVQTKFEDALNRAYIKYTDEFYTLELTVFDIESVRYIGINNHIIPLNHFLNLESIQYINYDTSSEKISELRSHNYGRVIELMYRTSFGHRTIYIEGCTIPLITRALSDKLFMCETLTAKNNEHIQKEDDVILRDNEKSLCEDTEMMCVVFFLVLSYFVCAIGFLFFRY